MNQMIIAVDATALVKNRTGVGNYIYSLLYELVKIKKNKYILYSNQEIFFPDYPNIKKVVHFPYRKGPAWQNTQLIKSLFKDKPDIFWGGNGYLPIFAPKKTKLLLTVHDLVYKFAPETMPLLSKLSRRIFQPLSVKNAHSIIAVSQSTSSEMLHEYKRSADAIVNPQINPLFKINNDKNVDIMIKYQLKNYIITIGTLEPRKNLENLIKAYLDVTDEGFELPILAIAGGKGWMQEDLEKIINLAEKKGIVKRLGFVPNDDIVDLYQNAFAFILASTYEGFGMPALEAQLCGCPVLLSNIPSLREASGNIGSFFEPDFKHIKKFLINLSNNKIPLTCRLPYTIQADIGDACNQYLEQLEKLINHE